LQGKYNFFDIEEQQDGYDLVEWIARQSWCDENVGIMGSFYGCTALAFQLGQNKQPSKMAREVVLMDEDSWGC